jgi:hypothetical protein
MPASIPHTAPTWTPARRWVVGLSITAAALAILAAIAGAGIVLYNTLASGFGGYVAPAPLLEGDAGSPIPLVATDCDDPCFNAGHQWEAKLEASDWEALGTGVVLDPAGTYLASNPIEQYDQTVDYWTTSGLTPDACAFAATEAPVTISIGSRPTADDPIYWLTSFESESGASTAIRSLRLFDTAADAQQHFGELHGLIDQCTSYGYEGVGPDWATQVTPMPALEVPPTVAAIGWTETTDGLGRYYVVETLRSNAVVRLLVWTNNAISEEAFRRVATTMATDMGSWPLIAGEGFGVFDGNDTPQEGFQPEPSGTLSDRKPCTGECFTAEQASSVAPTAADLAALGLTAAGNGEPVALLAGPAVDARQLIKTTNAQCRFALGVEPVVRGNPSVDSGARDDELVDLGRYERGGTSIRIVARVFENPERAEAYTAAIDSANSLCSWETITTAEGDIDVTMLPAKIVGYDSIDDPIVTGRPTWHSGWQHDGGLTDRGHELQHGNVVVRVVIESGGGAGLSEPEVARLLLPMIDRLEALEP